MAGRDDEQNDNDNNDNDNNRGGYYPSDEVDKFIHDATMDAIDRQRLKMIQIFEQDMQPAQQRPQKNHPPAKQATIPGTKKNPGDAISITYGDLILILVSVAAGGVLGHLMSWFIVSLVPDYFTYVVSLSNFGSSGLEVPKYINIVWLGPGGLGMFYGYVHRDSVVTLFLVAAGGVLGCWLAGYVSTLLTTLWASSGGNLAHWYVLVIALWGLIAASMYGGYVIRNVVNQDIAKGILTVVGFFGMIYVLFVHILPALNS